MRDLDDITGAIIEAALRMHRADARLRRIVKLAFSPRRFRSSA